ncbi:nuclear receptor subfamily 6 group A member 1-like isoform X2 [Patiria miniata]|uniref:Nuclear receptor subfamily 6 group A member 1 n=1 Tax=Patiria miniata TaxID=46514 RepID=A0A914AK03_PATMI|nr:nuclear receptor subfamily 6 group A member 1-like isoform X2 [Patiria miniata]
MLSSYRWGPYSIPGPPPTQTSSDHPSTEQGPNGYEYSPRTPFASPTEEMKTCLICGDRATGLHYGIVSCEGCKGFFKRSVCNRRVYRCLREKNCMMSRQKRNRCQYCRLLKCLQVGMNRKAIREDGMPGGRNKSIGPVKLTDEDIERIMTGEEYEREDMLAGRTPGEQTGSPTRSDGISDQFSPTSMGSNTNFSPEAIERFTFPGPSPSGDGGAQPPLPRDPYNGRPREAYKPRKNRRSSSQSSIQQLPPMTMLPEIEVLIIAEPEEPLTLPFLLPSDKPSNYSEIFELLCMLMDRLIHHQVQWVKRLPFACKLTVQDITALISSTWCETILLAALHSQPPAVFADLAVLLNNYIPSEEELRRFGQTGLEIIDKASAMVSKYQLLRVSVQEYLCIKVINFLNPDAGDLVDPAVVEELSQQHYYVLHDHVQLNNNLASDRFRALLLLLPDVRFLARKIRDVSFDNAPLLFKAIMHSCCPQVKQVNPLFVSTA